MAYLSKRNEFIGVSSAIRIVGFDRKLLPAATVRRAFIDLSATHTCAIRIQLQFSIVVVVVVIVIYLV